MKRIKIRCHCEIAIVVVGRKWKSWMLGYLYDCVGPYCELRRLRAKHHGQYAYPAMARTAARWRGGSKVNEEKQPKVASPFMKYIETLRPQPKVLCGWAARSELKGDQLPRRP